MLQYTIKLKKYTNRKKNIVKGQRSRHNHNIPPRCWTIRHAVLVNPDFMFIIRNKDNYAGKINKQL